MEFRTIKKIEKIEEVLREFSPCFGSLRRDEKDVHDMARKLAEFGVVIQALSGGVRQGFVAFYDNDEEKRRAYVSLLAVRPEARRKGIGRRLLNEACRRSAAAGMEKIGLEVDPENTGAVRIYKNEGFAEKGNSCRGKLLMEKELGQPDGEQPSEGGRD